GFHMRRLVTKNAVIRLAKRSQRQRVRRRSVKHEKHFAIRLENLAQQIRRLRRPPVFSVSRRVTPIRLLQRGPSFRTNSGVIIARKLPPLGSVFAHGPKTALPAPKVNPPAKKRRRFHLRSQTAYVTTY